MAALLPQGNGTGWTVAAAEAILAGGRDSLRWPERGNFWEIGDQAADLPRTRWPGSATGHGDYRYHTARCNHRRLGKLWQHVHTSYIPINNTRDIKYRYMRILSQDPSERRNLGVTRNDSPKCSERALEAP